MRPKTRKVRHFGGCCNCVNPIKDRKKTEFNQLLQHPNPIPIPIDLEESNPVEWNIGMNIRNFSQHAWLGMACVMASVQGGSNNLATTPHLRHPVSMAWSSDNQSHLIVANGRAGSLSIVDVASQAVISERKVADSISDMLIPKGIEQVLILDDSKHGLRIIELKDHAFNSQASLFIPLPHDPHRITLSQDAQTLVVGSKWSRQLTLLSRYQKENQSASWNLEKVIDLTFAPGELIFLPGQNHLLIADAFKGMLVLMKLEDEAIIFACELPINNIANLSFEGDSANPNLWLSAESLNSYATTINPEVTWGVLMDNQVRSIPLEHLMDASRPAMHLGTVYGMGDETGPGGDPGKVIVKSDGALITALQGVDRVAFRPQLPRSYTDRISVGDRPMDMVMDRKETKLYVLNQFSDSISIIDLQENQLTHHISLGPQPELSDVDRGERLFYDATLSLRGWYSCHSCHTDGHTTGLLNDNLGDDHFGSPKRILTLLGVHSTEPFSWLGKVEHLEEQIAKSLEKTMLHRGSIDDKAELLASYLKTLDAAPSILKARNQINQSLFHDGKAVFRREGCHECHKEPHYTSPERFDVGVVDKAGNSEFNPPSLRGISQRDTFLHDNRASSIEDLLFNQKHPEPSSSLIPKKDRSALLFFLNSL